MTDHDNPFLHDAILPPFHRMEPRHVAPAVDEILRRARSEIEVIIQEPAPPTWENVIEALERATQRVDEGTTPIQHLVSVSETPELRSVYQEVLPEISRFWSELPKNQGLWARVEEYAKSEEANGLEGVYRRHLEKTARWFRRSGSDLPPEERETIQEIQIELSELERRFAENVLDATAAYRLPVEDEDQLVGLPDDAKRRARAAAQEEGLPGFLLTLDAPSFDAAMKHVEDRSIREELHGAYTGRCRGGEFDNREIIVRILQLRADLARTLGYPDFPDYRVQEWMVKNGARVESFLQEMTERTRPYWERDVETLKEEAVRRGLGELRPWDVSFLVERIREERFDLDEEELRPYFPLPHVQKGLFHLTERLFGLQVEERPVEEVWHSDVRHYDVRDGEGTVLGSFYTDWFPRKEKRQGAWMNNFRTGGPEPDGTFAPHLGFVAGNFRPPEGDAPALLTHREVQTLFHEFGHLLHHITSRVPVRGRAGLNVAWDWVEVPSQLMENWTWEREGLEHIARHVDTGEPLPTELHERLLASRAFMGGWRQMRQLGFGTVDFALHREFDAREGMDVLQFTEERLRPLVPDPLFARSHILTSFTHLFAGGYAAGYFSYLWSEVLEADIFTRFRREGILAREVGEELLQSILSAGDSDDPEVLFRRFMARPPDSAALLERNLGELRVGG